MTAYYATNWDVEIAEAFQEDVLRRANASEVVSDLFRRQIWGLVAILTCNRDWVILYRICIK